MWHFETENFGILLFFNVEHTFHDLETKDYADDAGFYKLTK